MRKLQDLVDATEAAGFRVIGLIVAPDVMRAFEREVKVAEDGNMRSSLAMRAGFTIEVSDLLPPGCVAPKIQDTPLHRQLQDVRREVEALPEHIKAIFARNRELRIRADRGE